MRLLDLFCGAGGAAMGYYRVGFEVIGVDIAPMPHYPFEFHQADALEYCAAHGAEFDAIHASPPCQAYTFMQRVNTRSAIEHPRLIEPIRKIIETVRKLYVIENVPGAPLNNPMVLCGSSFGLKVRRHRLFEMNFFMLRPNCLHTANMIAVYGDHPEDAFIHRRDLSNPGNTKRAPSLDAACEAMGIDWMDWDEITQAIPPAYTEFIGSHLMSLIKSASHD